MLAKAPYSANLEELGPQEESCGGYYPGRQASPQKQLIAWLGIPKTVDLESLITIISHRKHH